jgi:diguanylate cyclase (GGDEF)-like protein
MNAKRKKESKKPKSILIADDSTTMILMLQEILQKEGYEVLTAEDGIKAVMKAFEHYPDLIISDIEMPKMDGYQVCRLLKNDPLMSNTPVIILTSKDSTGAVFWGYQTGADLYVLKDFKSKELLSSIQDLLKKYEDKPSPAKSSQKKVDAFQIMEKLNQFLDTQLFEMTLINEINRVTVTLTSISETLTSLLTILDKAIDNFIIGFIIFSFEKEILLSIRLNKTLPRKITEMFQYQSLEDLALTAGKDISNYNIEVELLEDPQVPEEKIDAMVFDPNLIYSIPIRVKDETFGLLNVFHPNMPTVSLYQKKLLEKLAPHISTAIGTISMHNKIKSLSVIDGLTQLYNRRHIMELFKTEFVKSTRYNSELSIVMIDIDNFKNINDTHGHLSGDLVLKMLSNIIKKSLRNIDLPGRYGGEEFLLILPETGITDAQKVAERIRDQVQNYKFKITNGEFITATISLGVAVISEVETSSNEMELIKIADSRLYHAKRMGKNRVVYNK